MNKIEVLINRITKDSRLYIDVYDAKKGEYIDTKKNAEMILAEHNSVMDYFKSFYKLGISEIGVEVKKINGTSFFKKEIPVIVVLKPTEEQELPVIQNTPITTDLLAGAKSLPIEKYMDLSYTERDFKKLVKEHEDLKVKALAEKKKRKKYQRLFEEVSTKSFFEKPGGEKLLGVLETLGGAYLEKSSGALAGGKQVGEFASLSKSKQDFVNIALKDSRFTDEDVVMLSYVYSGMVNLPDFKAELTILLTNHNLKA